MLADAEMYYIIQCMQKYCVIELFPLTFLDLNHLDIHIDAFMKVNVTAVGESLK